MTSVRDLAAALAATVNPSQGPMPWPMQAQQFGIVWGVVNTVVAGPPKSLTITFLGGGTRVTGIRYAKTYTPTVGDNVFGLAWGPDIVIIGALA